jgi:phenylpropionate dioxygenase-like ring-hydroxylating dioxygenase large terminal subunit
VIRVPVERYTSAEFAARELADMWPKVWVVACTLDHVAEAGDVFEHRLGPYSVLVVRGDDGELRAFQNHCRHRGNSLCSGSASGLTELRCGYHRWTWDLQGQLSEVPGRKAFGPLRNEDFPLVAARVDTWGPLVFVNLDPDAMPLEHYLDDAPADIAWAGLDDFRCVATVATPVEGNWKVVVDGFSETYHLTGLHPEMIRSVDDVNIPQVVWGHVSAAWQDYGVPSPRIREPVSAQAVWESFVATQGARVGLDAPDHLEETPGQSVQDAIAVRIRAHNAARGVDLDRFDTGQMLRMSQYNLFPNTTVTVFPDLLGVLTARPGPTPDQAEFVLLHFERAAGAGAPRSKPIDLTMPAGESDFGLVLNQDTQVVAGVQRGMHQPGCTHITLSDDECRIVNTHRLLDHYLGD